MDQVTKTKTLFRTEQWKNAIAECQASGLPIKTWCDQNGFKEQSYYYYLRKIRQREMDHFSVSIPEGTTEPVVFKKLEVQSTVPSTQAAVIIHLPSASLEIRNGATQQTVEAVLLALKCIC